MKKVYWDVNNKKGITLIALVITIIVLLILAGVAVSSITGNDDIMDKAQNAKVATDNANEEEEIKMAAVQAMADNMEGLGVLTADKLKTALNNKYPVSDEGDKIKVFANSIYTLDKNGSVTNDGATPKGEFSITSFSYTPNTVTVGNTSSAPSIEISGTPYQGPKYTSNDTNKATVDESTGIITGVAAGEVTITVTYKNYQNVDVTSTATVSVQPQNPYSINQTWNYGYTGAVQTFTAYPGTYKLEVWGGQGGYGDGGQYGGYGGYSYGTLSLSAQTTLYVWVGGQGKTTATVSSRTIASGGWNGGGAASNEGDGEAVGSGGGGTDISLQTGSWNSTAHLYSRIIVAGGGGGDDQDGTRGGSGGGTTGTHSSGNQYAGSQTGAGTNNYSASYNIMAAGGFGYGCYCTNAYGSTSSSESDGGRWRRLVWRRLQWSSWWWRFWLCLYIFHSIKLSKWLFIK